MRRPLFVLAFLAAACRRDPDLAMLEAPPALQACVPAGDTNASVVDVYFSLDGHGTPTNGCFSSSHDAGCIKEFIARSSRGGRAETRRMLIVRTTSPRPGASAHVGLVTFGEAGKRPFKVLGDPCALPPL